MRCDQQIDDDVLEVLRRALVGEHGEQLLRDLAAGQLRERLDRELLHAIEARIVIARDRHQRGDRLGLSPCARR